MSVFLRLKNRFRFGDRHLQEVARGAAVAFALKVAAAGVSFAFSVVLARVLGVDDAGLFFFALTVATVLSVVGRMGFDYSMLRSVSAKSALGDWEAVKSTYWTGMAVCAAVTGAVSASVIAGAGWLTVFGKAELAVPLAIMGWSIVPMALYSLHSQVLQGLKRVADAVTVLSLWAPLVALILTPALASGAGLGLQGAAWGYVAACVLCLGCGVWRCSAAIPGLWNARWTNEWRRMISESRAAYAVSVLQLVLNWLPVLLLGAWGMWSDVARFSAAQRTALLVSLILIAINSISAPKFAALAAQRDLATLGRVARISAGLATLAALPFLIVCLAAPRQVMLLFGKDFAGADQLLAVLAIGQFVNVAKGSVGHLLMMTGNDAAFRNNLIGCSLLAVLLNVFAIPSYGALGAAWATTVTICLQNVISSVIVQRSLGITLMFWGRRGKRPVAADRVELAAQTSRESPSGGAAA